MSFIRLLHSEWTKFRTIRGWLIGVGVAVLALILVGLISALGSHAVVSGPNGQKRQVLTGPDGAPVTDDFTFVHRTLTGDGSITVRVASLTGDPDLNAWAKAGVMVKSDARPGSPYVAVLRSGGHGIRMQYNFTGDVGGPTRSDAWLRLIRTGSTFTGYASTDGTTWIKVASRAVRDIPATAEIGMFVTSPPDQSYSEHAGGVVGNMSLTQATGSFDSVTLQGPASDGTWTKDAVSGNSSSVTQTGSSFTLTGSGNIAPISPDGSGALERTLVGTFAGLTVLIVLGVLFVTSEYRRGMIRTTFAASPHRGRVLLAKAVVIGAVGFVAGLIASAVALPLCRHVLLRNGNLVFAVSTGTELRLIFGTAAATGVAAVFALGLGTLLRRSVGAVAAAIVLIVLPYLLATAAIVPAGGANWLLRLTPAATFAIQQSVAAYHQVDNPYTPALGYFPLSPWSGFGVLCVYAAAALGLAVYAVRRRDV